MRRIGVLTGASADDPEAQARHAAFLQGLAQLGWTDGRNVRIDARYAAGNAADARKYAAELVALAPDVIMAGGPLGLAPLLQATRTMPIVFAIIPDPVGSGFVADHGLAQAARPPWPGGGGPPELEAGEAGEIATRMRQVASFIVSALF